MRGCITKRKNSWAFVIDVGKNPKTGRRKQKWKSGFPTRKDAELALANALSELGKTGEYKEPSNERFSNFLLNWMDNRKPHISPSTWQTTVWLAHNYIIPSLGGVPLSKLTSEHLQTFNNQLLNKLSSQSVVHAHRLIKMALEQAYMWDLIPRNVARFVKPPRIVAEKFSVWDDGQLRSFLEIASNHRLYIAFLLAAATGMRQGEVLGLRWKDVDFEKGNLAVSQALMRDYSGFRISEPKTASSKRTIAIPPNVLLELKRHRRIQLKERMEAVEYADSGLVVQSLVGTPVSPFNLSRTWRKLLKRSGVTRIRFHDLRHTHATLLLKQGVHPKIVSERLGHSSVQITLDTYSHLLPNMQEAAALRFGELLEGNDVAK